MSQRDGTDCGEGKDKGRYVDWQKKDRMGAEKFGSYCDEERGRPLVPGCVDGQQP